MIDWLRWLGILPVKLFFSFTGEGAFICPMAFVLPVEEIEWNFLSSTAAVSSAFVVSFFAMVTINNTSPFLLVQVITPTSIPLLTTLSPGRLSKRLMVELAHGT